MVGNVLYPQGSRPLLGLGMLLITLFPLLMKAQMQEAMACETMFEATDRQQKFQGSCDPVSFPCDQSNLIYYPVPGQCTHYFICDNLRILKCPCPGGTAYSASSGRCVHKFYSDCLCPKTSPKSTTTTQSTTISTTTTSSTTNTPTTTASTTTSITTDSPTTEVPTGVKGDNSLQILKAVPVPQGAGPGLGLIVGVAVGSLVVVVALGVLALLCVRRRNKASKGPVVANPQYSGNSPIYQEIDEFLHDPVYRSSEERKGPLPNDCNGSVYSLAKARDSRHDFTHTMSSRGVDFNIYDNRVDSSAPIIEEELTITSQDSVNMTSSFTGIDRMFDEQSQMDGSYLDPNPGPGTLPRASTNNSYMDMDDKNKDGDQDSTGSDSYLGLKEEERDRPVSKSVSYTGLTNVSGPEEENSSSPKDGTYLEVINGVSGEEEEDEIKNNDTCKEVHDEGPGDGKEITEDTGGVNKNGTGENGIETNDTVLDLSEDSNEPPPLPVRTIPIIRVEMHDEVSTSG